MKGKPKISQTDIKTSGIHKANTCCGIIFGHSYKTTKQLWGARIKARGAAKGLILITTSVYDDEDGDAKNLVSAGFKRLSKFYNPNTGNMVTLWGGIGLEPDEVEIVPEVRLRGR